MAFGKRNQVSVNILDYNIMLLGESGAGKTSLINDVCNEYTHNPESALFLEIGQERGADAISGINYINCPEWDMDYDELSNSAGFATVCEDIIENKISEYPNLKVVVFDTLDQLITVSEKRVLEMWNKECRKAGHPEKCTNSINACYSGFGRGEKKAIEIMLDMIARLRSVGVATIIIGHCKQKQIEDTFTGQTYQILTSDQQQNYFNAIKKNTHFIGLLYVDRQLAAEKTGKKIFGTNKDETVNRVVSETRRIRFRDDGAVVDCKSRFANITPEIEFSSTAFIKALEDAIKAEINKSGKSFEEAKADRDAKEKIEARRIAEAEAAAKIEKQLNEIKSEIIEFFTENKNNIDVIKPVLEMCRERGFSNPQEIDDLEVAKKVLKMCR
jgi:hypothetical protein